MYHGERFNSISHSAGALLATVGGVLLIVLAAQSGDPWKIVSFSVYSASLLALYLTSTLYHSVRGAAKDVLRRLDHCAIYLLIAGSYTPFTLVTLRGPWGWSLFGVIWTLALAGAAFEILFTERFQRLSVALYVGMGWCFLVAIRPLMAALDPRGLGLMLAGGAAYTLGVLFYLNRRLRYGHAVWHGFVLAGSALHYFAILLYVVPGTGHTG